MLMSGDACCYAGCWQVLQRRVCGWVRAENRFEPVSSPVVDEWQASAQAMVADALATLRTFDVFAAYRVSVTPSSDSRTPAILAWDPPTGAAWDAATHLSRGLHDRANQLFWPSLPRPRSRGGGAT